MRKDRFREEQILGVLKEGQGGVAGRELCREHGICEPTYDRWKSKRGGLEVGEARRRFGYRRLGVLLRRQGWAVNHKRVHRLYRQEHRQVRKRLRKRTAGGERLPLTLPSGPNERGSMDFMTDSLATGRPESCLGNADL